MTNVHFEKLDKLIIENLKKAEFDVKIAVAWITDLNIIKTLEECKKKGISITVIFFNDKINNIEYFESLYKLDAQIHYTSKLMHNKFCVIDEKLTLNGSYNWTNSAKSNNENIQITDSKEIALKFSYEFERILKSSISVSSFFVKKKDDFEDFFIKIDKPISYPNFYKIDLDKFSLRNSMCYYLKDIYITKGLKYIYKLFETEEEFEKFFKYTYSKLGKYNDYNIHIFNRLNKKKITNEFGNDNEFIAIDILNDKSINDLSIISSTEYVKSNVHFTSDDIIYFDNTKNEKFLIIGVYGREYLGNVFENKLVIISLFNNIENFKIKKYKFNLLEKTEDNIVISDEPYVRYPWKFALEYRYYLNLDDFELDEEKSNLDFKNRNINFEYNSRK